MKKLKCSAVEAASLNLRNFLRDGRIGKGLSQVALADLLGYESAQYVSDWERGVSSPPLKKLAKITEVLDLDLDRLFDLLLEVAREKVVDDLSTEFSRIRRKPKR